MNCGFDIGSDMYSTIPYGKLATTIYQYFMYLHDRKMKSDITTYSYAEMASLLINNEQVDHSIHSF